MGTIIATTSSGGRLRVARRPGVMTELIAFGHPSGIRGPRVADTTDRRVRRRSACEGLSAHNVRRTD